ncbi:hypothetical protein C8035_v007056 [Colletotrichum spinosum]|uniref:Ribosomal RNA methyltransferase FtsJ domain-containing protein n=1 Tax=Colletotrichum spinosum TaxID=1347390 RepID=A0A4R8QES4_9PEZI|nr:hypothetical protein C8035_v007056 [Colletotrichum spinosum]
MCMAPGGFLQSAMDTNRRATALAFTLPVSQGGHKVQLHDKRKVDIRLLDITMLAEDMGVADIPADHPDVDNFLPRQFDPGDVFDLAFCDGQVLRTQPRAEYRERYEAHRLTAAQLALSVEHLRPGGTMVVLFHRIEAWATLLRIRAISKFADVTTFKPTTSHTIKSSFYLVAKNVRSRSPEALEAVKEWKRVWKVGTFGPEKQDEGMLPGDGPDAHEVLADFGDELVRLGRGVWEIQADALERAPFISRQSVESAAEAL